MTYLVIFGLFIVGMLLIAVEVFFVPGFSVPGIAGIAIVVYAAYYAWTELEPLWGLGLGGVALIVSLGFFLHMPRSRIGRRLTLDSSISGTTTYDEDAQRAGVGVGQLGTTVTDLRPSGFAMFGTSRVEVRTSGEFIPKGSDVEVLQKRDGRVFVEQVEPDEGSEEPADIADNEENNA